MLRAFQTALLFMTTLPITAPSDWKEDDARRSVQAYPLVGLTLGLLLALALFLMGGLPGTLRATLCVALWLLLTGALHFDGLCDTADAAFASKSREERQRIAKDPSIGAFAFATGGVLLLVKINALAHLPDVLWLVVVLTLSRTLVVWPLAWFRLNSSSTLGRSARISRGEAVAPLILGFGVSAVWAFSFLNVVAFLSVLLVAALYSGAIGLWLESRLDGLNGDSYGALIETSEAAMLVALAAL